MHSHARTLLGRFTYANVMSTLAVILVVGGGTAYAASSIGSGDIINKSIRSVDIKNGQVKKVDLRAGAVDSSKILDGTITGSDLGADAVDSSKVLSESLTGSDLATNSITALDLAGGESSGVISLSAGFVAVGRCRDFDMAVGGALPGDAVIFSVNSSLPDGIVLYGVRVSSAGVVVGKACNLTGATFPVLNDIQVEIVTIRL